jgi:effector-binding domain-containing protein
MIHVGPYTGDNMLRKEFTKLVSWVKKNKVEIGKWFFYELDGPETPSDRRRWETCLEIKGGKAKISKLKPENGIQLKELQSQNVASVTFNPEEVSARLVYHGLECWLQWRKKYDELEEDGPTREVYIGDPWTNNEAWTRAEVQVPVRELQKQ